MLRGARYQDSLGVLKALVLQLDIRHWSDEGVIRRAATDVAALARHCMWSETQQMLLSLYMLEFFVNVLSSSCSPRTIVSKQVYNVFVSSLHCRVCP